MSLYSLFENSAQTWPEQPALWVNHEYYTYAHLKEKSRAISTVVATIEGERVALFAHRSITAYSGVLGILESNKTYVPLNPKFPSTRNSLIVDLADVGLIVVGKECLNDFAALGPLLSDSIHVFFPDTTEVEIPAEIKQLHTCYFSDFTPPISKEATISSDIAYILFTSGSTGLPKGVPVKDSSVVDYVQYLQKRYKPKVTDRFSQTFDLTFDLSVHDMFLCWASGSCLYSIPEKAVLGPGKFIRDHELTFWFSVPSVAQFMDKLRMLKPGNFPSLRVSLFCGEPLPESILQKWILATNGQLCENIYGPTEATIGISHFSIPNDASSIKSRNGIVSIGKIFTGQEYRVVDGNGNDTATGELWVSGSQIADGYWNDEDKTREAFSKDSQGRLWYHTGDLVELDSDGDMYYLSRKDFQVKIRGYRIEMEEINHSIEKYTGEHLIYSMPWPINNGIAESIYTFVSSHTKQSKTEIMAHLATILPEYMVPKDIIYVDQFPLNSNGKVDKLALVDKIKTNE